MTHNALVAQPIISGTWKFDGSVPFERVIEIAQEWAADERGSQFIDLHVRACSMTTMEHAIGFKYQLHLGNEPDDWKRQHRKFFCRTKDALIREFGERAVRWDVSSSTHIIV